MTIEGLDYSGARPSPAQLRSWGVRFVCRYVSSYPWKNITAREARSLRAAGIDVVLNFEDTGRADVLGGRASGERCMRDIAAPQARAVGYPHDACIYFSVDFDAQGAQLATVGEFFAGAGSVGAPYQVGAYGSYAVVQYLLDRRLIDCAWQTYAWSAGRWDPRVHIEQYANGSSYDHDRAVKQHYGSWATHTRSTRTARHPGYIYPGARGDAVRRLQADLNTVRGPGERKLTVDGDYGPASQARAVEFKRHHGLTADAIVGTGTFAALGKSVAAHRKPAPAKPKPPPRPAARRPAGAPPDLPAKWYGHWSQPWHGIHAYPSNYLGWLRKKGHLSPHFTLREAACHDGTPVPARLIGGNHGAQAHAFQLERLRHALGDIPIPNTSWYRTPAWNAHVGGASQSQHIRADATDHGWDWVDRVGRKKVQAAVERIFANDGIGTEGSGHALHVDSRGTRARWVTW